MACPIWLRADSSTVLSSHSVIALSRCSSLHGSILNRMVPNHEATLNGPVISAAQHAARPVHTAALAKKLGEKHATGPAQTALHCQASLIPAPFWSILAYALMRSTPAACSMGPSACLLLQVPKGRASCMEALRRSVLTWLSSGLWRVMAL